MDPLTMAAIAGGGQIIGGLLGGNAAKDAAATQAAAQLQAAQIAADAAKFRPVGVTTNFGSSNFTIDPKTGYLTNAGYTLTPAMKAAQDALLSTSAPMLDQFGNVMSATAPMGAAAQNLFQLGANYLSTTPQAQAQKYLADQMALVQPGRDQALAATQNTLAQQGRTGIAIGGGNGMMATNPELAALYNANRMQDLTLAANATQGGMDYSKFGAAMTGLGADTLKAMYGTQVDAFNPYRTALGGATSIEALGQNALDLGSNLGRTTTASNQQAGGLLAAGMTNAAATMAPSNAYSPWANIISGATNALKDYSANNPATTPTTPTSVMWGGGSAPSAATSVWGAPSNAQTWYGTNQYF